MAKYTAYEIKNWTIDDYSNKINMFIPTRPIVINSIWFNLKMAFAVLLGLYDVLDWQEERIV